MKFASTKLKKGALAGAAAVGLAAGSYGIASAAADHSSTGTSAATAGSVRGTAGGRSGAMPAGQGAGTGPGARGAAAGRPAGSGRGPGGRGPGGQGGAGSPPAAKITAIGTSTITIEGAGGGTHTFDTSSSTTYSDDGTTTTRSELAVGDVIEFTFDLPGGSRPPAGSSGTSRPAPTATSVEIVPSSQLGKAPTGAGRGGRTPGRPPRRSAS